MTKEQADIKPEYEKIRLKYKELPGYEEINREFELGFIEKINDLPKQIRRKINERIILFSRIIENIIYPSMQNILSSYESATFNEKDKEEFSKLHKKLMVLERKNLLLDIKACGEKEDIQMILDVLKQWKEFKDETINVATRMYEAWQKEAPKDNFEKYFG